MAEAGGCPVWIQMEGHCYDIQAAFNAHVGAAIPNATLPYAKQLAASGAAGALAASEPLRGAANAISGKLTNEAVAQAFDVSWTPPLEALADAE